jgi:hydrogenase maturation protein HypF
MGRLFDAVSSLIGLRDMVNYEGQAAIELEAIADPKTQGDYPFEMREYVVDPLPIIRAIVRDLEAGVNKGQIAMRFHRTVSKMILKVAQRAREERGLQEVVLSGGCFQNLLLLELTTSLLEGDSFKVYTHHKVPPNDGGLSLGQAYYGSRWEA